MTAVAERRDFAGNDRFEVQRRIGAGGWGTVYAAFDRERRAVVALKTLGALAEATDANALARFKNEFRALTDVSHPNLVQLHELFSEGGQWFFTMELIDGVDFVEWASGDPARLRPAAAQLAQAIDALHCAGKVHRDVKPSNVLVSREGRVVLVDFGLAIDLAQTDAALADHDGVLGTPTYMSPEQGAMEDVGPASDWYSMGAVLYRALTGRAPFEGGVLEVLTNKQLRDPPRPRELAPGIAEDLDALCMDLLARDPAARPAGPDVLRRLGVGQTGSSRRMLVAAAPASGTVSIQHPPLVGREAALAALRAAFDGAREAAKPVVALVHGESGLGKSSLLRRFVEGARAAGRTLVLAGSCYERESVPYKAVDGVVDALAKHLLTLPPALQTEVTPRDAAALARVFPVLDRVPSFAAAPRKVLARSDAPRLRRLAFGALRELLGRMGDRWQVVVVIDDLQWADADSAALLREVVAPPDPPALLLVLAFRSEDLASGNGPLAALVDRAAGLPAHADTHDVRVAALTLDEGTDLARKLLGAEEGGGKVAELIAREAGGSPFFIGELVRWVQSGHAPAEVRLATVVRDRLELLPESTLRLLRVVALAGRPLPQKIAFRAADVPAEGRSSALGVLRATALVRTQGVRADDPVECFHAGIAAAVVGQMSEASLRTHHADLARALAETGTADPESLYLHSSAAGQRDQATLYAVAAGQKAQTALAFDRAAQFYRAALDALPPEDDRAQGLRLDLADALANAGRGPEAADAYLSATAWANAADRLALQRRAAEELLFSGHIDVGTRVLSKVLFECRITFTQSRPYALLLLMLFRTLLALRGLKFTPRDASMIPARELTRIDVSFAAATGLSLVDNVLAVPFGSRTLLAALRAGEVPRVHRALVLEAILVSTQGGPAIPKVERYLERARLTADLLKRRDADARLVAARGMAAFFRGAWRAAHDGLEEALALYRQFLVSGAQGPLTTENLSARWEVDTFRYFSLAALVNLGRLKDLDDVLHGFVRDAEERGDLYLATNLAVGDTSLVWLAKDRPDRLRATVERALGRWPRHAFLMQDWWELHALAQADLYEGSARACDARVAAGWGPLQRSLLMRAQYLKLRAHHLRGRAALALATEEGDPDGALTKDAETAARAILADRRPWADPMAELLLAAVARRRGDVPRARERLVASAAAFAGADMALWAAIARRRLGQLQSSAEGAQRVLEADGAMRALGVVAPDKLTRALAPGLDP